MGDKVDETDRTKLQLDSETQTSPFKQGTGKTGLGRDGAAEFSGTKGPGHKDGCWQLAGLMCL